MKVKQIFFVVMLISLSYSFSSTGMNPNKGKDAAPSIEVIDIQPANSRGSLYYLTCAPKSATESPTAQFSTRFVIRNKETKSLVLKGITYTYKQGTKIVSKTMTMDIDDASVKEFTIEAGKKFAWQNSRDYHKIDDAVFFESPFPSSIQIKLQFEGYSHPYIITRVLGSYTNYVNGGAYEFPGKLTEMGKGEYWYAYGGHGGGGQFYAYDIIVMGWDEKDKKWATTYPGKDRSKNEHYRAYGKSVIAIGDGVVLSYNDGEKENIGDAGGGSGGGNWIKINNGKETVSYFHMQPGSLNKNFLKKGAIVKKGDFIGALGNAGASSEPHGHVHVFQDFDADASGQWVPYNLTGISIIDHSKMASGPDPAAQWTKVDKGGLSFMEGRRFFIWPAKTKPCLYPSGLSEIGRNAIPENKYMEVFNEIWNCGYYPVWVDAYDVAGKTYFNAIFRYNSNKYEVIVRHDMSKEQFLQEYKQWVDKKGYRLQQLDNYVDGGKLKFAVIFIKKPGQAQSQPAYHGVTPEQHQQFYDNYSGKGYVPINVSVTTVGGNKYYSAFYEKRNVGGVVLKSAMTQQEYQDKYAEMNQKKWEQVYINAYDYKGKTLFSAIWYEKSGFSSITATRRADKDVYNELYDNNLGKGFLTQCVTGYGEGGKHWFAAHWAK